MKVRLTMATSFGALCTDFYINLKLGLKMDLPSDRQTVLSFFDRVRADLPQMNRLRRFTDETALESPRRDLAYQWLALRKNSVRCGHVNPESMDAAYQPHELILRVCPYYLALSPLDIECCELLYGFDLECNANHNQVIFNALYENTPAAALLEGGHARHILDLQPMFTLSLDEACSLHATFEIKTNTARSEIRNGEFRGQPISVLLTLRKTRPVGDVEELPQVLVDLRTRGEELANDKLIPHLLTPVSRAITSSI